MVVAATARRTSGKEDKEDQAVRLSGRGARRGRSVVFAVALVVVGASAAVTALSQVDQRVPVLVADADLPAGHQVTAADVQVVELAGADSLPTVSDVEQAVGATLTAPVTDGALLSEELLGADGEHLAEHQAAVGAQLTAGRVPSSVDAGSRVTIVITEDGGDVSHPAEVQTLTPLSADESGEVLVDLVVDASHAAQLARAAAEDQIALVHTSHDGSSE